MKRFRKLILGLTALAVPLSVVAVAGVATSATASGTTYVTSVAVTGTSAAPIVTVKGVGFGAAPTGIDTGSLSNCGGFTGSNDYPTGKLWLDDATVPFSAGAYSGGGLGSCVGINIVSYTGKKIVFSMGSGYGSFGWTLHTGDGVVVSVKGAPGNAVVPAGF